MREYMVLRDTNVEETAEPFGSPRSMRTGPNTAAASARPTPSLKRETLSTLGVFERARQRGVEAVTASMPISLIKPFEVAAPAQGATNVWGIDAVGATSSSFTGKGVTVAVLDTGIDRDHPAFKDVEIIERDFTGTGGGDRHGHGTHCAGTIFGRDVDNRRIGVAPGVERVLIGKILDDRGGGSSLAVFEGIKWALSSGAHVISMSVGFDFPGAVRIGVDEEELDIEPATSRALEDYRANLRMMDALMAMGKAQELGGFTEGCVVVAASGNESRANKLSKPYKIGTSLPAAAQDILAVGAVQQDSGGKFGIAPFSNIFPQICAPGVNIVSARANVDRIPDQPLLIDMSGTSMACPHVAGVCALWWEALRSFREKPNGAAISARVRANARTSVFADNTDISDRGAGLAAAPSL
jgi:subtilisin family serine protease